MGLSLSKQLGLMFVGGIFAWLVGCAAPPAEDLPGKKVSGGIMLHPTAPDSPGASRMDWLPVEGRMGPYARKRHLPPETKWTTFFTEEFDNVTAQSVPGWRITGAVQVKPVQLDGESGIEIRGPDIVNAECGLQCDLDPAILSRRDLHLQIRFSCRSLRRVQALQDIKLSLLVADRSSPTRLHELTLPIIAEVTAGWETANWWLRFGADISAVTLRIDARKPGAILTLEEINCSYRDLLSASCVPPASQPSPVPINLIVDGDFETGQVSFYTSGTKRWPNGDEIPVPQWWVFDDNAAVGNYALMMPISGQTGRVAFGPLDLNRHRQLPSDEAIHWYLSFHGRAERATNVTVSLHTRNRTIGRYTFQLSEQWQRFTQSFTAIALTFDELLELAYSELIFDFAGLPSEYAFDEDAELACWLDAVALTDQPIECAYVRAAPVQVGLTGPAPDSADLANLLDEKDVVSFGIRLVAGDLKTERSDTANKDRHTSNPDSIRPTTGKLAIDLLDAWDRVVWTRTTTPAFTGEAVINGMIKLQLPRGYYRVLATLWSGEPGESTVISQADLALAVISLTDPVPLNNMFGLSSDGGNVSIHTTQLGAGWVRMDLLAHRLQVAPVSWDFSWWEILMQRCESGHIQAVVGLTLPHLKLARLLFLEPWLIAGATSLIGVVISPPAISVQPTKEYIDQLLVLRKMLAETGRSTMLVRDLSASSSSQETIVDDSGAPIADVVGFACTETALPEMSESLLEAIGQRHFQKERLWDLRVPVRIGGRPTRYFGSPVEADEVDVVQQLPDPIDPVRSASRMVRSLLLRSLAGAEMVCCDAFALSPVRSIYDDDRCRLHEADLSPRVALVAFDLMTSLINDATLTRWIDEPVSGCRILFYEKDDGRAVVALWRPFGLSPTRLGFANLPPSIGIIDCVGLAEPEVTEGDRRVVQVNEIVRYLVAPAEQRDTLRKSLDTIQLMLGPTTQPVR